MMSPDFTKLGAFLHVFLIPGTISHYEMREVAYLFDSHFQVGMGTHFIRTRNKY